MFALERGLLRGADLVFVEEVLFCGVRSRNVSFDYIGYLHGQFTRNNPPIPVSPSPISIIMLPTPPNNEGRPLDIDPPAALHSIAAFPKSPKRDLFWVCLEEADWLDEFLSQSCWRRGVAREGMEELWRGFSTSGCIKRGVRVERGGKGERKGKGKGILAIKSS